jgi:DNA-directed RNA polymerase subunit alpha
MPNIKEDALEIILNLKLLRLKLFSEEPVKLTLSVKGDKKVTAADFKKDALVEIVNPELPIATITSSSGSFEMDVWVAPGRGYKSIDERGKEKLELGMIAIDARASKIPCSTLCTISGVDVSVIVSSVYHSECGYSCTRSVTLYAS